MLYEKLNSIVKCKLCGFRCTIHPGKRGICGVRENRNGTLYTLVYGKAISYAIDPIEKKPLFHFYPGALTFSLATVGCNFRCVFCDNWCISQDREVKGEDIPPERIVKMAKMYKCKCISYTYTEPTIFFEYAYDTAKLAHKEGIYNTFVTNGYITPEAIDLINGYLNAATVDFKGSGDPDFYKKFCKVPDVSPIYQALIEMKRKSIFIEITNLIVTGGGDSKEAFIKLVKWILDELGESIPLHILRFFPSYMYTESPPPSIKLLEEFYGIAKDFGLKYVYLGNVPGHRYENTYCPNCNNVVIKRLGFEILDIKLKGKRCVYCNNEINIII
ncbi:MAG: AmmeMemoRadiSam system radical SAM enzyme [Candidatus Methanomethylicaceae archaeon]